MTPAGGLFLLGMSLQGGGHDMASDTMNDRSKDPPELDSPTTVLCKLFSDNVSEQLCMLRKKELHLKGGFSCEDCPMDAIMRKQLKLTKEFLGLSLDRSV
jgi:hypothetical protein